MAERTWTFDYPGARLLLWPQGDSSPPDVAHRIPLGFQVDAQGRRTTQFARLTFVVDRDSLDALFDTGATVKLTPAALPMIRVASITVAGLTVGPVWFTQRPESAFPEYMSKFMDRPVIAALGGSALQFFRVTMDYPNAIGYFERPQ